MDNTKKKVFIDGDHGTVGLQIKDRLLQRTDVQLIEIETELRKNTRRKSEIINDVDVVFLCLPDEAARESVSLIENEKVIVLDGSTAHRTHQDWVYGIPELNPGQRDSIRNSTRISVPGCYASGFALMVHPLVREGIMSSDYPLVSYALTGYSGGGKPMIADYQQNHDSDAYAARPKNLNLKHKHLPEMMKYGLLDSPPIFTPIVGNYYQGLLVFLPVHKDRLSSNISREELIRFYTDYYDSEKLIHVLSRDEIDSIDSDFIDPTLCNGTNNVDLFVFNEDERILIVSRLDNLGKGASGAAVQNLDILLGLDA